MGACPFWLVWSPQGDRPPRYRHDSERDAELEADRLSTLHPGREFYVVQPTYRVVTAGRQVERYSTDDVPF